MSSPVAEHPNNASNKIPMTRTVKRTELDLSVLHRQLYELENNIDEVSEQEKIAQYLELLTRLTNSAASAYFYLDLDESLAIGPRVISKKASNWDPDILAVLHQSAKNSLQSGRVLIERFQTMEGVSILVAPGFNANNKHCAIAQLLQLDAEPIESFVVILQLFVSVLLKDKSADSSKSNQLCKQVLREVSLKSAQQSLVDTLANNYPNVIVWTGIKKSSSMQLGCYSLGTDFNKHSAHTAKLTQAMVECMKANESIVIHECLEKSVTSPILKKAYNSAAKAYFGLIPIKTSNKENILVLGLSSDNKQEFNAALMDIHSEGTFLGDILQHKSSGLSGLYREFKSYLVTSNKKIWFKPLLTVIPLVIFGLMMFPVTYKIDAAFVIEPVERRFISAPFKSILKEVYVEPGDIIKLGDVLAELDDRELKWKYSQLQAEYEQANKQKDIEMAIGDTAKMQLSKYEVSQYKAKIDLLKYQLDNLKLTSPIAGLLVSGDIKKRQGSTVTIGDNLFEVAPLNKVLVEVAVPAEDISYIEKDMPVKLRINALPNNTWTSQIDAIHLRSTLRNDSNVFIAELVLNNESNLMRPGMNGKAKIYANNKPLIWVLFHRAWNKLVEITLW